MDDNYLAPPVDEMDDQSDAGSSKRSHHCPDIDNAMTEQEQIDAIQHEIDDLIKEDTLPTALKIFRDFDANYMMPIFKRPLAETQQPEVELAEEGG